MTIKEYSTFPKAPALLEPHYKIVYCHIQDICWRGYPSAEKQSVYSTALADWEILVVREGKDERNMAVGWIITIWKYNFDIWLFSKKKSNDWDLLLPGWWV